MKNIEYKTGGTLVDAESGRTWFFNSHDVHIDKRTNTPVGNGHVYTIEHTENGDKCSIQKVVTEDTPSGLKKVTLSTVAILERFTYFEVGGEPEEDMIKVSFEMRGED